MNNMLIAQSGGPTAAINASLSGAIQEAIRSKEIDGIYGALNGIQGVLAGTIVDLRAQFARQEDFSILECTPAMALGSCRFRLPEEDADPALYEKIDEIFHHYQIAYFFYIGGNDSMDTVDKLARHFSRTGQNIKVIGIPKPSIMTCPALTIPRDSVLRPNLLPLPCWRLFETAMCMTRIR